MGPSHWLFQMASKLPQKEAILDEEISLSFEELYRDISGIANWLYTKGEVGQRVLIAMPQSVSSAILYFGAMLAGQVAVPINPFLLTEQLKSIREEIDPQFVFGPSPLKEIWSDARFFTVNGYNDLTQWLLIRKQERKLPFPHNDPFDLLNIVYTSGTSGRPKGVMLNVKNLEAVIRGICKALPIHEESRIFSPLPFSHTYGLSQLWIMAKTGATLALAHDITNMAWIKKVITEHAINTIAGVPYHFVLLTRRGEKEKMDSVKLVTIAGEAPTKQLINKIKSTYPKAQIFILYGLTEASTRLTTLPSDDLERKEGSIGVPIEGVELKIIDENGKEVGPFEEGELIARGENISPGYWKDKKLTQMVFTNGWLHTGDIVKRDDEGYYYHIGRKDFMFKSGGEKIIPEVIERVLREIDGVRDAAVFGRKDAFIGNRICAVVVKEKGSNLTLEGILSICKARLGGENIPHEVIFAEEIPKTSIGKIHYDLLKNKFHV